MGGENLHSSKLQLFHNPSWTRGRANLPERAFCSCLGNLLTHWQLAAPTSPQTTEAHVTIIRMPPVAHIYSQAPTWNAFSHKGETTSDCLPVHEEAGTSKSGCLTWYNHGWLRWLGFGDKYWLRFYKPASSTVLMSLTERSAVSYWWMQVHSVL